ncbi:MAG: TolC family outer membrane protein [Desulfovibrionaceae bacterium]|nr:TolC family outer membrane protein [Desulfovibrionaceae bacterium]
MTRLLLGILFLLLCLPTAVDARKKWPNPPKEGASVDLVDTVYGVLRTHRSIRGMQENKLVLEYELDKARGGFGPQIVLEGRGGGSVYSDSTTRGQDLDGTMYSYYSGSAKLVQPIWDGFATRSQVREATSTLESQKHRLFDTATSLSLDGIIAHIDLLRRRTIYELAVDNLRQHKELLDQEQERVTLGADTAADLTQTQSRLARAESSLSEAKAALRVAEYTYVRLTGMEPAKLSPVTLPPKIYEQPAEIFKQAQKSNPKILAYLQDIKASRARREGADAAMSPTVNLEVGPSYTDRGGNDDRWIYSFDVLGTVRWNIFNSGRDLAERKAASARMRQSRQVMYDFFDTLRLDIESTWYNYLAAKEQYEHYSKAVEFNKYTREAYIEQFSIGKRSLLDVLDTINELHNSSTQAETARGNILVGAYRLAALAGTLLPDMKIDLEPLGERAPVDKTDKRERFAPGWFK